MLDRPAFASSALLLAVLLLSVGLVVPSAGTVWTVRQDGTGDFATIADAIAVALDGDEVVVGCGTYFENGLVISTGITLRSETSSPDCVTINAQRRDRVIWINGASGLVTIQGIEFLNGQTSAYGGGLQVTSSSASVSDARFSFCVGSYGGGFGAYQASVNVSNCTFLDCSSTQLGGGAYLNLSSGQISSSQFERNTSQRGGGLAVTNCSPDITACEFKSNTAEEGAGVFSEQNGGIQAYPDFIACSFEGNTASLTGGAGRSLNSHPAYFGCIVVNNEAVYGGGLSFGGGTPTVHECTVAFNRASTGAGGLHCQWNCVLLVSNTIVAFNDLLGVFCDGTAPPSIVCTDIYGNVSGDWVDCVSGLLGVHGNISEPPLFCDAPAGDYTIGFNSPCFEDNSGGCGRIGALGPSCNLVVPTKQVTWGAVKMEYLKPDAGHRR